MTIMAHSTQTANNPYVTDPVNHYPDGSRAPAVPDGRDPYYGRPTTWTEIAHGVDLQLVGAIAPGQTIGEAATFTRTRKAPRVPKMGAGEVLTLEPFRAFRALADLMDTDQIHSPYVQLLDLVLTASERTQHNLARAQALDAAFPAEQMDVEYESLAEQILADLRAKELSQDTPAEQMLHTLTGEGADLDDFDLDTDADADDTTREVQALAEIFGSDGADVDTTALAANDDPLPTGADWILDGDMALERPHLRAQLLVNVDTDGVSHLIDPRGVVRGQRVPR